MLLVRTALEYALLFLPLTLTHPTSFKKVQIVI